METHVKAAHRHGRDTALVVGGWLASGLLLGLLLATVLAAAWASNLGASQLSLLPSLLGSIGLAVVGVAIALPLGGGAAIAIHELSARGPLRSGIDALLSAMASLPSLLFGLGIAHLLHSRYLGLAAAGLALGLMAAPFCYVATREALAAVPAGLRESAYALGASRIRALRQIIVPIALPSLFTATILTVARIVGETAILLVVLGASAAVMEASAEAGGIALPFDLFRQSFASQAHWPEAAVTLLSLLAVVLALNAAAIYLRARHRIEL